MSRFTAGLFLGLLLLTAARAVPIGGTVLLEDGHPAPGTSVRVLPAKQPLLTDVDGRFAAEAEPLLESGVQVLAFGPGGVARYTGQPAAAIELRLTPLKTARLAVQDERGRPLPGAGRPKIARRCSRSCIVVSNPDKVPAQQPAAVTPAPFSQRRKKPQTLVLRAATTRL